MMSILFRKTSQLPDKKPQIATGKNIQKYTLYTDFF